MAAPLSAAVGTPSPMTTPLSTAVETAPSPMAAPLSDAAETAPSPMTTPISAAVQTALSPMAAPLSAAAETANGSGIVTRIENDSSQKRRRVESDPSDSSQNLGWEVLANHGWVPFDDETAEKIDKAIETREDAKFSAGNFDYTVDIHKMKQINLNTGVGRHIRAKRRAQSMSDEHLCDRLVTSDELAFFHNEGYLLKQHFFTTEQITAMKAEIFDMKDQMQDTSAKDGKPNHQLHNLSKKSLLFRYLASEEFVQEAITTLLGGSSEVYLDGQLFRKPARVGMGTAWHQDNAYFHELDPLVGCGMWIAINDSTAENGTLHVIPRVHTASTLQHVRDDNSDHLLTCCDALGHEGFTPKEVPCILQAGGVVFFSFNTPHCTKDNRSEQDRTAVAVHFRRSKGMPMSFRVLQRPNLGIHVEVGGIYTLSALISMCDSDTRKIHSLVEHVMDPSNKFFEMVREQNVLSDLGVENKSNG